LGLNVAGGIAADITNAQNDLTEARSSMPRPVRILTVT